MVWVRTIVRKKFVSLVICRSPRRFALGYKKLGLSNLRSDDCLLPPDSRGFEAATTRRGRRSAKPRSVDALTQREAF
jgi:hypothetical protein